MPWNRCGRPWIDVSQGPVLADAGCGHDMKFRDGISELGLFYVLGMSTSVSVRPPGQARLPKRKSKEIGRRTTLLRPDRQHPCVSEREWAMKLVFSAWQTTRYLCRRCTRFFALVFLTSSSFPASVHFLPSHCFGFSPPFGGDGLAIARMFFTEDLGATRVVLVGLRCSNRQVSGDH
jgi:hypothetical protein